MPPRGAEVGYGKGYPLLSRSEVMGGVVGSRSGVQVEVLSGNAFWCILKATERSFLHPYADALSS